MKAIKEALPDPSAEPQVLNARNVGVQGKPQDSKRKDSPLRSLSQMAGERGGGTFCRAIQGFLGDKLKAESGLSEAML